MNYYGKPNILSEQAQTRFLAVFSTLQIGHLQPVFPNRSVFPAWL
jgi:hypothetical protein